MLGESPKPHSMDFVAALLLSMLKAGVGTSIKGRSFDLKSAYKKLAISVGSLNFAYVAVLISCLQPLSGLLAVCIHFSERPMRFGSLE